MIDTTVGGMARARLQSMKAACEKKGLDVQDLRFNGIPLSELSREDLEIVLGYRAMKDNDLLGADVCYAMKAGAVDG